MILAFAHPCIVVNDVELARKFYEQAFGFHVIGEEGWRNNSIIDRAIGSQSSSSRGYMLAGHNCFLELFEFDAPAKEGPTPFALGPHENGIRHLSFYVDDCRAEYDRCLSLGAKKLGVPAPKDSGVNAVYLRDPCGNIIELCEIQYPEEHPLLLPGITQLNHETPHV